MSGIEGEPKTVVMRNLELDGQTYRTISMVAYRLGVPVEWVIGEMLKKHLAIQGFLKNDFDIVHRGIIRTLAKEMVILNVGSEKPDVKKYVKSFTSFMDVNDYAVSVNEDKEEGTISFYAKPEPHGPLGLDPKVVVDNNNVYILYVHLEDVYLLRSQDGGNNFSGPVSVSRTDIDSSAAVASGHTMVAAGNRVYVAWTISNFDWSEIFFARSDDGGRTFGQVRNVSDNPEISHLPELAVSAGNVYVAWTDVDVGPSGTQHTSFARSNDQGDTFERTTNLSGNPGPYYTFEHQISARGDAVYLVWRDETPSDGGLVFAKSTDRGETFSFYRVVENGAWPVMTLSRDNIYLAYGVQEHIQGRTIDNVAFVRSTDGGETFSEPLMLSNQTWGRPSPFDAPAFPSMASDGNNVFVAWRYTTNATRVFEVLLATSYDGGDRFTPPTVVSTGDGDVSHDLPALAADSDTVAVVWIERAPDENQFILVTGTIPPTYTGARDLEPAFMTPVDHFSPPYFLFGIGGVVAAAIVGIAFVLRKRRK